MYGGCLVQQLFSFARNSSEMLRTYCTIQLAEMLASLLQFLCSLLICFEVTLLQLWDLCRLCCFLVTSSRELLDRILLVGVGYSNFPILFGTVPGRGSRYRGAAAQGLGDSGDDGSQARSGIGVS
jgi:hypothetical protein